MIGVVRFPVVLFDLDGTLIDFSGPMILASFRHATSTVLARDLPDDVLLAGVGGSSLEEQMTVLSAARSEELVAAYRAHNEPLHDELRACAGIPGVLAELHAEGRRLGIVTAKRRRTVALAFETLGHEGVFGAVVTNDDVERGKPHPDGILLALDLPRRAARGGGVRRRLALRRRRRARGRRPRRRGHLGRDPLARGAGSGGAAGRRRPPASFSSRV